MSIHSIIISLFSHRFTCVLTPIHPLSSGTPPVITIVRKIHPTLQYSGHVLKTDTPYCSSIPCVQDVCLISALSSRLLDDTTKTRRATADLSFACSFFVVIFFPPYRYVRALTRTFGAFAVAFFYGSLKTHRGVRGAFTIKPLWFVYENAAPYTVVI